MRGNTTETGGTVAGLCAAVSWTAVAAVAAPAGTAAMSVPAPMASPSPASAAPRSSLAALTVSSGPGRGRLLIAQPR